MSSPPNGLPLRAPVAGAAVRARVHDLTCAANAEDRLSVASLCMATSLASDGHAAFLPDAVAPRDDWRRPSADELAGVLGVESVFANADVLLVDLPGVAHELRPLLICGQGDVERTRKAVRDVRFVHALDERVEDLIPFCTRPEGLVCQGPWVSPGEMRVVTLNLDVVPPRRIGLHVDNWDDLPLADRAPGRRRLCVNIGSRPRYLVFLQTPLSTLVAAKRVPGIAPGGVSPAVLVRAYLGENLDHLAFRVRVDPGEAYIVNADDVIHDGSTAGSREPDVALHFLGHFGPPDEALGAVPPQSAEQVEGVH